MRSPIGRGVARSRQGSRAVHRRRRPARAAAPATATSDERLARAALLGHRFDSLALQPSGAPATLQRSRFGNPFFDPMAELDAFDAASSDSDGDARADFVEDAKTWDFDDVTTDDFRDNHVVEGGQGLLDTAEAVAKRRNKPLSTSVLFTEADKTSLTDSMRAKALSFAQGAAPNSLQHQTTKRRFLFAEHAKDKKGRFKLGDVAFGKMQYAAQGFNVLGGKQYEVNHLDGMTARQSS